MEIKNILAELYALDPSLKEHEESLLKLIGEMSDLKPDTKFDKRFAARLKKEILQQDKVTKISFNFMNKKIYLATSSLAVLGVIIFLVSFNNKSPLVSNYQELKNKSDKTTGMEKQFVKLDAGAYGSLTNSSQGTNGGAIQESFKSSVPMGLGGGQTGSAGSPIASDMAVTNLVAPSTAAVGRLADSDTISKRMMPSFFNFKYVYKGEELDLKDESGDVYRRIKGDGQMGSNLAGLLNDQNLGPINLKAFNNLKMTNLSLIEDRELGLMINFDFNEDNVYLSENWEKWRIAERESCSDDACFNRFRLKIQDVPDDNTIISLADNFLKTYGVSTENYGQPSVENYWRQEYERYADKNSYYIPEYITVVYPLMINNEAVHDQSGNYSGLRVTVNILKKAASGLNGLMPYRYETSSYALETNKDNVIKAVENGGWNNMSYYTDSANGVKNKEIELGTPVKSLVQTWKYNGQKNEELLVPALVFPVLNPPSDYYGNKFITVPLVKDMLSEINGRNNGSGNETKPFPMPTPEIMYR